MSKVPATNLSPITTPLPFYQWGIDILGPFHLAKGQRKFLIVVGYLTKWLKQNPFAPDVRRFIWRNMITMFGIPKYLVFDSER